MPGPEILRDVLVPRAAASQTACLITRGVHRRVCNVARWKLFSLLLEV